MSAFKFQAVQIECPQGSGSDIRFEKKFKFQGEIDLDSKEFMLLNLDPVDQAMLRECMESGKPHDIPLGLEMLFRRNAEQQEQREADSWDRQIEADALAGRFDAAGARAIADHEAGRTTPL